MITNVILEVDTLQPPLEVEPVAMDRHVADAPSVSVSDEYSVVQSTTDLVHVPVVETAPTPEVPGLTHRQHQQQLESERIHYLIPGDVWPMRVVYQCSSAVRMMVERIGAVPRVVLHDVRQGHSSN